MSEDEVLEDEEMTDDGEEVNFEDAAAGVDIGDNDELAEEGGFMGFSAREIE